MSNKVRPCTLLDDEFFTKTRFPIAYYDTDIAVQREEERESAFAEGEAKGIEQGIQQGFSDGSRQKAVETAKLMKQANCELDFIMQMTGLSKEDVENI